uniref:Uncharacterized protein n=1 Tax=Rhizophora mucronata TaxID=61149 RepID=A0A2P2KD15_RHIMU
MTIVYFCRTWHFLGRCSFTLAWPIRFRGDSARKRRRLNQKRYKLIKVA